MVGGSHRDLKGNGSKSVIPAKEIGFRIRRRLNRNANIDKVPPPVRLADERLTTVAATTALRASGVSEKKGRKVIDQAAAVEIFQSWMDVRANAIRSDDAINQPSDSGD